MTLRNQPPKINGIWRLERWVVIPGHSMGSNRQEARPPASGKGDLLRQPCHPLNLAASAREISEEPLGFTIAAASCGTWSETNNRNHNYSYRKSERLPVWSIPFQRVLVFSYKHQICAALAHAGLTLSVDQCGFGLFLEQFGKREQWIRRHPRDGRGFIRSAPHVGI